MEHRSKLLTIAAILILLPGLVASLGTIHFAVQLGQGPPAAPGGISPELAGSMENMASGYSLMNLAFSCIPVLVFVPAGLRLLRRRRFARVHATIVVMLVAGLAMFGASVSIVSPKSPGDVQTGYIVGSIVASWALFILIATWRKSVKREFN